MDQRARQPAFLTEADKRIGRAGVFAQHELERHAPAGGDLLGFVNRAHAAAAEPAQQPIAADRLRDATIRPGDSSLVDRVCRVRRQRNSIGIGRDGRRFHGAKRLPTKGAESWPFAEELQRFATGWTRELHCRP